jgi:ferric-dicitrate binding protein FerR (iron transport regulator)
MSHDSDATMPSSPEERHAAEEVRALGEVRVDPAFRERLRRDFVAGSFAEAAQPPSRRPAPIVPLFAFAAAASAALLVWLGSAAPQWKYAGATGTSGEVWVCGHLMNPADSQAVEAMLHPGTSVRTTGDMQVDLVLADRLTVQVAPATELTVPDRPRRWFGGAAACDVLRGEARFMTGREMPGSRFVVRSPLATIEVTGTTFAVIVSADSACVCVLDGSVTMTDPDGSRHAVAGGLRRTVFPEGKERVEEILPMERMKLEMLPQPDLR